MYRNLKAEMARAGLSVTKLAADIGVSEKTLRNKINEETDFTWSEALAIRRIINPQMEMEELFAADAQKEAAV